MSEEVRVGWAEAEFAGPGANSGAGDSPRVVGAAEATESTAELALAEFPGLLLDSPAGLCWATTQTDRPTARHNNAGQIAR